MKKIRILIMAGLLTWPAIMLADDSATTQEPVATATAPQPDENIDDSTVTKTVAPVVAAVGDIRLAPGLGLVAKTVDLMSQQITELQSEVIGLQQQTQQAREQVSKLIYAIYALSVLVILLALLSLTKSRKKSALDPVAAVAAVGASGGSETDYDFMASNEAIPAKLDLARAYIAMEDFNAARETLTAVLNEGNEEQRLEAKSLLSKIR